MQRTFSTKQGAQKNHIAGLIPKMNFVRNLYAPDGIRSGLPSITASRGACDNGPKPYHASPGQKVHWTFWLQGVRIPLKAKKGL